MNKSLNSTVSFIAGIALLSTSTLCPVIDYTESYKSQNGYFDCVEHNSSVSKYTEKVNMSTREQILSLFGETRDMTIEESEGYKSYLQRISKPTGFDVFSIL